MSPAVWAMVKDSVSFRVGGLGLTRLLRVHTSGSKGLGFRVVSFQSSLVGACLRVCVCTCVCVCVGFASVEFGLWFPRSHGLAMPCYIVRFWSSGIVRISGLGLRLSRRVLGFAEV